MESGAAKKPPFPRPGWTSSPSGEWHISPSGEHRVFPLARSARGAAPEVAELRAFLDAPERKAESAACETHRPWVGVSQLVLNWVLMAASWALCVWVSPWFAPLALVVFGTRMRALGNQLHNASHGGLCKDAKLNRRLTEVLAAWPNLECFEYYRLQHLRHHAHLGDHERDPDYLDDVVAGRGSLTRQAWNFFRKYVFKPSLWVQSMLGTFRPASRRSKVRIVLWWVLLLSVVTLVGGPVGLAWFAGLWLVARATVYHAVKVFAELSDHIGLIPGTIAAYTRNLPSGWAAWFFHPHGDNYHLAHHLFPKVPLQRLHVLHGLLQQHPLYAQSEQCETYFFGQKSVVASWVKLQPGRRVRQSTGP